MEISSVSGRLTGLDRAGRAWLQMAGDSADVQPSWETGGPPGFVIRINSQRTRTVIVEIHYRLITWADVVATRGLTMLQTCFDYNGMATRW